MECTIWFLTGAILNYEARKPSKVGIAGPVEVQAPPAENVLHCSVEEMRGTCKSPLLFQPCGKIRHNRHRLTDLLLDPIKKDFLPVRRDIVEHRRGGPNRAGNQNFGCAKLQRTSSLGDRNDVKVKSRIHVEEFLAVAAPLRLLAAIRRHLPFPLSSAESGHVDFACARFRGRICDPAAVRRYMRS